MISILLLSEPLPALAIGVIQYGSHPDDRSQRTRLNPSKAKSVRHQRGVMVGSWYDDISRREQEKGGGG